MLRWIPIEPPTARAELWVDNEKEEVTWLRGHPPLDSPEVHALQAARALR
jgi:hypothetical protein